MFVVVADADAVAVAPELDVTPVVVKVEIEVPMMLSMFDVALEPPFGEVRDVDIATVLKIGLDVPVVTVSYGLMVGFILKIAHICATPLIVAVQREH